MYKAKLRSQNKLKKNNKKQNQKQTMSDAVNTHTPVQKRLREVFQTSLVGNTPKTRCVTDSESLYLTNTNSPLRFMQVLDRRFDKLTEQLKTKIQTMFQEYEQHLLSEIDKRLNIAMSDLNNLTERVLTLETAVNEIKTNTTVSDKIEAQYKVDNVLLKEIETLKKYVKKHENSIVSHDLRINGIPHSKDENLFNIYKLLCETTQINPPIVKELYRVKINKNNNFTNEKRDVNRKQDAAVIIKFSNPHDRNYVLRGIKSYVRVKKGQIRLNQIGFNSSAPIYVNENLTPENHKMFTQALKLKKDKMLSAAFTFRGIVYVKSFENDEPVRIDEFEDLQRLFRSHSDEPHVIRESI